MFKMLKSNYYRIIRGKGLYIALGAELFLLLILIIFTHSEYLNSALMAIWTELYITSANWVLMIIFIFWISAYIGASFSSGAYIHKLTAGNSRIKIYFAEFFTVASVCVLNYILFYLLVFALWKNGESYEMNLPLWNSGYTDYTLVTTNQRVLLFAGSGTLSVMGLCALVLLIYMNMPRRTADILTKILPFIPIALAFTIYLIEPAVLYAQAVPEGFVNFLYAITLHFPPSPMFMPSWIFERFLGEQPWWYAGAGAVLFAASLIPGVIIFCRVKLK